ncbi:MAG: HAMP domain-containing protein, partial [Rhodoferax sp.]|uniref:methyl-accepting chemotaxis protein n=1 Tax=Rhodoferax sp. TaxID=50421 RepID=UPI0026159EB1
MNIGNLKIATRLGISFTLVALLSMLLGLAAFMALDDAAAKWQNFSDLSLQKRDFAAQGRIRLGDAVHNFKNFVLRGGDANKKFAEDLDAIDAAVASYGKKGVMSARETVLLGDVLKATELYRAAIRKAAEMQSAGTALAEIDKEIKGADKPIAHAFDELLKITGEQTLGAGQSIAATTAFGKQMVLALSALVLILAALCAWLVSRSITRPLGQAVQIARTVAAGDLTSRIDVKSSDETGQVMQSLKDMNDSLVRIVGEVRGGTDTIASASSQIAAGNLDLSGRTEQQASSLEETAASMEQLTSTVKQNADNARQANQLAVAAS